MSGRDRCGWPAGTNPTAPRILRFAELLKEALDRRDAVDFTPFEAGELCDAIWRQIDAEEENGPPVNL